MLSEQPSSASVLECWDRHIDWFQWGQTGAPWFSQCLRAVGVLDQKASPRGLGVGECGWQGQQIRVCGAGSTSEHLFGYPSGLSSLDISLVETNNSLFSTSALSAFLTESPT